MNKHSKKYNSLRRVLFGYYTRKDAESVFEYMEKETEQAKADFEELSDEFWRNYSKYEDKRSIVN